MAEGIRIRRGVVVPVRRQIAAELEDRILAGRIAAGGRLPSHRDLARRLGVHRNTIAAAYRELERQGLVRGRPGSGVYVRSLSPAADTPPAVLRRLLLGLRRGFPASAAALAEGIEERARAIAERRLAVVDDDPGLLAPLVAELRRLVPGADAVGVELRAVRARPALLAARLPMARPHRVDEVTRLVAPWGECLPLRATVPGAVTARIAAIPSPATVGVISTGRTLRARLRELAWRRRGESLGVLEADPGDRAAVARIERLADLALADVAALPRLPTDLRRRAVELRLVARSSLPELLLLLERRPPMERGAHPRR